VTIGASIEIGAAVPPRLTANLGTLIADQKLKSQRRRTLVKSGAIRRMPVKVNRPHVALKSPKRVTRVMKGGKNRVINLENACYCLLPRIVIRKFKRFFFNCQSFFFVQDIKF